MTDDRDDVVGRALRDLPVPDHGSDFWASLERRLADEEPPVRVVTAAPAPLASVRAADDPDEAVDDELPVVVPMGERRPRRSRIWIVSVAAVLALVVGAAVSLTAREPASERVRIADDPEAPATTQDSAPPEDVAPPDEPTTTTQVTGGARATSPDGAVLAWIEAVAEGDLETAAALTGPRSRAYVEALTGGASLEGFLTESGEGYGAWADSPDRSTTEVELAGADDDITIVVLSGTWTGEGGTGFRTQPIPAVRTANGTWLVEPWAIDPGTGGRIDVISPSAAEEEGFNGLAPDATLSASAPGGGTFHFSLDDQPATAVAGQKAAGGVRATFDPPGDMASRTHLFVIAYVDGETISAVAGTFLVEG